MASCNKTHFLSVSNCTSKPSVPICKYNTGISGSPSSKNLSILDILNASDGPIMEEIFRRLLNEFALLAEFSWVAKDQHAHKKQDGPEECHQWKQVTARRKLKYATIILIFRKLRMIKSKRLIRQVTRVLIGQRIVARGKNSLPGLVGVLDAKILSELTDEDLTLRLIKIASRPRYYEGFARIDPYIKTFWDSAAVIGGCIIIDGRTAIPSCLQRAVLSVKNF